VHTLGATHRLNEASEDIRFADHERNLALLPQLSPALADAFRLPLDPATLAGRAAVRCTGSDTLPIVGTLDERGLHVTTAHGSRGLVTTLLAAEVLASSITAEAAPLPRELMQRLSPARFGRSHGDRRLWHHRSMRNAEGSR
jgi:tRNA 5-methylaminomethyl-2-thiouridine biosynthesis bifunctional protein